MGREWRYTYFAAHKLDTIIHQELMGTIGRFDRQTQTLTIAELDRDLYPTEPIHIVDRDHLVDRGLIVSVIYDEVEDRSEIWIYDCDRLNDSPVCRLCLPSVVPMSFHGT